MIIIHRVLRASQVWDQASGTLHSTLRTIATAKHVWLRSPKFVHINSAIKAPVYYMIDKEKKENHPTKLPLFLIDNITTRQRNEMALSLSIIMHDPAHA